MPTPLILSYAKRSKQPVWKVEDAWKRAKEQAEGIRRSKIVDKDYWRLVNGLVKKELGLSEAVSFKEFILEILDKKVDFNIDKDEPTLLKIDAKINGRMINFWAEKEPEENDTPNYWIIEFSELDDNQISHHDKTGSGKEFEVFAFIGQCIEELIKKHHPKTITFTADKADGNTRSSLYGKLVKKLSGYKSTVNDDGSRQVKFKLEKE